MSLVVQRHSTYGSYPWAIVDTVTGAHVATLPVEFDHPQLGRTRISGYRYFRTKREATAALADLLAVLPPSPHAGALRGE